MEDGRLVPLPIPETDPCRSIPYENLCFDNRSYLDLLQSLYPNKDFTHTAAHVDPDIVRPVLPRHHAWRGIFGQAWAAAGHLREQAVDAGDLFLFWGRFRETTRGKNGTVMFARARPLHVVFGYLQVETVLSDPLQAITAGSPPTAVTWAPGFPHFQQRSLRPTGHERVFIARPTLSFAPDRPGWGVFKWRDALRLSDPDSQGVSHWRLPACFDQVELSYNPRTTARNWRRNGEHVHFTAASRGQEFVCEMTPSVRAWAEDLIVSSTSWA
jgi:hypothetical protein